MSKLTSLTDLSQLPSGVCVRVFREAGIDVGVRVGKHPLVCCLSS